MSSDDSDDSEDLLGTHISDDETAGKRTRRDKVLRAADPEKQAKYQHGHQTEVTDAQGRVRFHGAFTGGFSAGYFNTAGSEEGWAPSEWRSSRDTRGAAGGAQRPEDFMDDEDLAELRGPTALVARAGFAKKASEGGAAAPPGSNAADDQSECSAAAAAPRRGQGAAAALASLLTVCTRTNARPPGGHDASACHARARALLHPPHKRARGLHTWPEYPVTTTCSESEDGSGHVATPPRPFSSLPH